MSPREVFICAPRPCCLWACPLPMSSGARRPCLGLPSVFGPAKPFLRTMLSSSHQARVSVLHESCSPGLGRQQSRGVDPGGEILGTTKKCLGPEKIFEIALVHHSHALRQQTSTKPW